MITVQPIYEYEIDYVKVGQQIKQARMEHKLSQAELGEKIGCSNNHMSHVEIGQTKPSLPMMLKLSLVLNKSLDYFFLDTPFTQNEIIINTELTDKLQKCDTATLQTISKIIDMLIEHNQIYIQNFNHNN